jgi:hypothetical protein
MDISVPSLFGYRSGSIKISNKAWSKLERFEDTLKPQNTKSLTYLKDLERSGSEKTTLLEESPTYGAPAPATLEERVERLEKALQAIVGIIRTM